MSERVPKYYKLRESYKYNALSVDIELHGKQYPMGLMLLSDQNRDNVGKAISIHFQNDSLEPIDWRIHFECQDLGVANSLWNDVMGRLKKEKKKNIIKYAIKGSNAVVVKEDIVHPDACACLLVTIAPNSANVIKLALNAGAHDVNIGLLCQLFRVVVQRVNSTEEPVKRTFAFRPKGKQEHTLYSNYRKRQDANVSYQQIQQELQKAPKVQTRSEKGTTQKRQQTKKRSLENQQHKRFSKKPRSFPSCSTASGTSSMQYPFTLSDVASFPELYQVPVDISLQLVTPYPGFLMPSSNYPQYNDFWPVYAEDFKDHGGYASDDIKSDEYDKTQSEMDYDQQYYLDFIQNLGEDDSVKFDPRKFFDQRMREINQQEKQAINEAEDIDIGDLIFLHEEHDGECKEINLDHRIGVTLEEEGTIIDLPLTPLFKDIYESIFVTDHLL
jgi:ethanolamine utilization microcompartment shell protein EutS